MSTSAKALASRLLMFNQSAAHAGHACSEVRAAYSSVFGWELTDMPEMDYTVVKTTPEDEQTQLPSEPGAINGGMYRRSADTPSVPVLIIDVNSVDDSLKEIEAAGGRVLRPRTEIPGMGAFAYFTDPEGNALGLWEGV